MNFMMAKARFNVGDNPANHMLITSHSHEFSNTTYIATFYTFSTIPADFYHEVYGNGLSSNTGFV